MHKCLVLTAIDYEKLPSKGQWYAPTCVTHQQHKYQHHNSYHYHQHHLNHYHQQLFGILGQGKVSEGCQRVSMLNSRQRGWRQAGFQTHYHLILFKSYQTITLRLVDILSLLLRIQWDALETLLDALQCNLHQLEGASGKYIIMACYIWKGSVALFLLKCNNKTSSEP